MSYLLLIEPDASLAAICQRYLQVSGHEVAVARTAQQGISAADKKRPEVVVLELQLVAHSGIEFLYEFRSYTDWANVPIIIYSNVPPAEFGASRDILRGELNVTEYLYKPQTSLRQLIRSVTDVVALSAHVI